MSRSSFRSGRVLGATLATAALLVGSSAASAAPVVWSGAGGNGNTYDVVLNGGASWDAARAAAQAAGGDLATIDSQPEQDFVESVLRSNNAATGSYWFGIREAAEGLYRHVDGRSIDFSHWAPGEPNNAQGVENSGAILWSTDADGAADPAMLARRGGWNDAPASGYPADGLILPPRDVLRAGYLLEISGDGNGNGNGNGGAVIPLPTAVYALPLGAAAMAYCHRRMRRGV